MSDIVLQVNGVNYAGWTAVRVQRSMEQVSGVFEIGITERWAGQATRWPIYPGAECRLLVDDEPLITGYVDDRNPSYDASQHTISIVGRDKTADLVDCAAVYPGGEWKNRNLAEVAAYLCEPYGIKVITETDVGARHPVFGLEPGESAFECIERYARFRGVLPLSDGLGNLLLTRATRDDRVKTALVYGKNILRASGQFSWRERFSHYIVKGQEVQGITGQPVGKAEDDEVKASRYRPRILIAEEHGNGVSFKTRAEWERNVRYGRAQPVNYTVQGWRHAEGVWRHNTLISVTDPMMDFDDSELLIVSVSLLKDESGTRTELKLMPREAFDRIPLPDKKMEEAQLLSGVVK